MIETSSNSSQTTRTTDLLCLKSSNSKINYLLTSRDNSISDESSSDNLIRKSANLVFEDEFKKFNLKSMYNNNNAHLNLKVNN